MISKTNSLIVALTKIFIPKPLELGRWNIQHSEKQKYIKFMYSNYDHCGDKVCTPNKSTFK